MLVPIYDLKCPTAPDEFENHFFLSKNYLIGSFNATPNESIIILICTALNKIFWLDIKYF